MPHDPPICDLFETILEGQKVTVNKSSKVVILELKELFNQAGNIFKWKPEYGLQAFGINRSILRLVELGKYKLLIKYHSNQTKKEYWITHDKLRNFIIKNKCEFKVGKFGKLICNIPLTLFIPKPIFSGTKQK